MNILHIVGNGLDLALGLKTKYQDFLTSYYLLQPNESQNIKKLKISICQELDNWADAELELGKYAQYCQSTEEYLECFNDFRKNLQSYLDTQSLRLSSTLDEDFGKKFVQDLWHPELNLEPMAKMEFERNSMGIRNYNANTITSIITFNYTNSIEHIFGYLPDPKTDFRYLNKLIHVHGTLHNQMTFGVNDPSQLIIENKAIGEDSYFEFVKPMFNDECLNTNNLDCEVLISTADLIVLYGVSLGDTDRKWRDLITAKMQKDACVLLYFPYDPTIDPENRPQYVNRWCKKHQKAIMEKLNLDEETFSNRVYVNVNKQLFGTHSICEEDIQLSVKESPIS